MQDPAQTYSCLLIIMLLSILSSDERMRGRAAWSDAHPAPAHGIICHTPLMQPAGLVGTKQQRWSERPYQRTRVSHMLRLC